MEEPPLNERITKAREELKLSRSDIAHMCGVSYATVANWELGRNLPQGDTLDRLNEVLAGKVGIIQLTKGEELLLAKVMKEGGYKTREEFYTAALVALIKGDLK